MKKVFLFLVTVTISLVSVVAQEKVDTTYYDKTGRGVSNKAFADYYRIALYPESQFHDKMFRDFYLTGELMSSGKFITINKYNDEKSEFEGVVTTYAKDGRVIAIKNYSKGKLNGLSEKYLDNGTIIQEDFTNGKPTNNFYIQTDPNGNMVKISYANNKIIWESPDVKEIREEFHDGELWRYYSKNGVTIALNTDVVRDYGKYHALNITISNNSLVPINFEPSCNINASSMQYKKNKTTQLQVFSCEDYLKKVDNRMTWAAVLIGVSEGLSSIDAGLSETQTVSMDSNGNTSVSVSRTYNATDAYIQSAISEKRMYDYSNEMISEREVRKVGYFKRSTINPGESVSGFAYVKRIKGDQVTINIEIEGAIYTFTWKY